MAQRLSLSLGHCYWLANDWGRPRPQAAAGMGIMILLDPPGLTNNSGLVLFSVVLDPGFFCTSNQLVQSKEVDTDRLLRRPLVRYGPHEEWPVYWSPNAYRTGTPSSERQRKARALDQVSRFARPSPSSSFRGRGTFVPIGVSDLARRVVCAIRPDLRCEATWNEGDD